MVISTGTTLPAWAWVAALYCLQKSMMFTAWGPRAVPTGGAGVAWPAGSSGGEERAKALELLLVGVDLGDRAGQRGERAGGDGDGLADLPLDPRLGLLDRVWPGGAV